MIELKNKYQLKQPKYTKIHVSSLAAFFTIKPPVSLLQTHS